MEAADETVSTTAQDKLFCLTIGNFVNTAPGHRRVLVDSRFSPTLADVDKWIGKEDLPELTMRSRMMDFMWSHRCNCNCN